VALVKRCTALRGRIYRSTSPARRLPQRKDMIERVMACSSRTCSSKQRIVLTRSRRVQGYKSRTDFVSGAYSQPSTSRWFKTSAFTLPATATVRGSDRSMFGWDPKLQHNTHTSAAHLPANVEAVVSQHNTQFLFLATWRQCSSAHLRSLLLGET
jgi:hypothetical protein